MVSLPAPCSRLAELGLPSELTLPRDLCEALRFTPQQFQQLCEANPEAVLELTAEGRLIVMTPVGGETSARNARLTFHIAMWTLSQGGWQAFGSCTGFRLPDGSVLSPDASLVRQERWEALTPEERRGFAPLCPDLVVELASPSDLGPRGLTALRRKMAAYQANGAQLGWLLLPDQQAVEIWPASGGGDPQRIEAATSLDAGPLFAGLQIDLLEIWRG